MAKVTVKLFGVLRMDTKLKAEEINIDKVEDIFDSLNLIVDERFEENKKSKKLSDGDEVWLLSPASGG